MAGVSKVVREARRLVALANDMTQDMAKDIVAKDGAEVIVEAINKGIADGMTERQAVDGYLMYGVSLKAKVVETPVVEGLERANKVTIQTVDGVFMARFYRTHKLVAEVDEAGIGFNADDLPEGTTKIQARDIFKERVIQLASTIGVDWDPVNRGQQTVKFTSLEQIEEYSSEALHNQLEDLGWTVEEATIDGGFDEMLTYNGKEVVSRYNNGTIAYAMGEINLRVVNGDTEGYVTIEVQVVSGQYKKPKKFLANVETVEQEFTLSSAGLLKAFSHTK